MGRGEYSTGIDCDEFSRLQEIASAIGTYLVAHLLKWEFQPKNRTGSWDGTIREQRRQIARELKFSPSLKRFLPEALAEVYPDAVERAI